MKLGKATEPDDIASEFWKAKNWDPTLRLSEFLIELFRKVECQLTGKKVPQFPYGKKGSPTESSNYRPNRSLFHTSKIFERILDNRIREIVGIIFNQAEFIKNCGTIDAIHAVRLFMEKHREKHCRLYIVFCMNIEVDGKRRKGRLKER